jgi:hypothetical protein
MDSLEKMVLQISSVYGEGSQQHDEALAVFRSADNSISRTQAVVYLCDILASGSLSREVHHPSADCPRNLYSHSEGAMINPEAAR